MSRIASFLSTARSAILGLSAANLMIAICCVGVWLYRNSLEGSGIFDDDPNVSIAVSMYKDVDFKLWIPRPRQYIYLSLALNHAFGGPRVRGFHEVNRLIHVAAALVLFAVVRRSLSTLAPRDRPARAETDWTAFAVALLWLVHPLQTEAVSYMVQRMESMMALCYLACLYSFIRGAQSPRAWPWYTLSVALFWIGVGTKEVIATAPLVMLMYDRAYLAASWREVFRRRGAVYLGMVGPLVLFGFYIAPYFTPGRVLKMGFVHPWITPWMYARTETVVILHYLRLAVWPDTLCLDYCWPVMPARAVVIPAAVVLLLLAASLWALRMRPRIGFLATAFFVILAPTSSVVPINDIAVEHRMYLPLACLVALAVLGGRALLRRAASPLGWSPETEAMVFATAVVVVAIPLSLRTVARNEDYRDHLRIWRSVVAARPESYRGRYNLGVTLLEHHRDLEALLQFRHALSLTCDSWPRPEEIVLTATMLSAAYTRAGYPKRVQEIMEEEIRKHPELPLLRCIQGIQLFKLGQARAAVAALRAALERDPTLEEARAWLAAAELKRNDPAEAVRQLRIAIARNPAAVTERNSLAWILAAHPEARVRDGAEAVRHAEYVCLTLKSEDGVSWGTLAGAYAEIGDFRKAVWASNRSVALSRKPNDPGHIDSAREQLACYESGRPYRFDLDDDGSSASP